MKDDVGKVVPPANVDMLNGKLRFFVRFLMIVLGSTRGFFQLTYFVTSSCNAKCMHCFNWESLNSAKNELTLCEISEITKRIPFLMSLIISGGEPFLRKDLDLVIERFYKDTDVVNVSIPTNGILSEQIYKTTLSILNKCGRINIVENKNTIKDMLGAEVLRTLLK